MTETAARLPSARGVVRQVDGLLKSALLAECLLLLALAVVTDLGLFGLVFGFMHAVGLFLVMNYAMSAACVTQLGHADAVTLTRSVLTGGVTALTVSTFGEPTGWLITLAAIALLLDKADGIVARRTNTTSTFGARFDAEADAFLILVLSIAALPMIGPAVLLIGAMRYLFFAAGRVLPWLRGTLPTRRSTKLVAALQGVALVVIAAGVLAPSAAMALFIVSLSALLWSFGCSVAWLWQHRPTSVSAS